jgi:dihydrofolate synthase/folylpolyglutamate synthase
LTFEEALRFLDDRIRHGIHPGLDRIAALTEALGHPQRSYPSIHVTGTNGKFSTAAMATAILTELGLTVGTFTSPHVESILERIAIGGAPIDEETFASVLEYLVPYIELVEKAREDTLTYFETLTAMAFEHFFDVPVHAAVVEVGLGGEYDATNMIDARVAVITKVALDHRAEFGDDLATIAWEKAGVIKAGSVVVSGVGQPELAAIVEERARERDAERIVRLDADFGVVDRTLAVGGQRLRIRGLEGEYDELFVPLHGAHQADNAAFAVAACEAFGGGALDPDGLAAALERVEAPGRIEVVRRRPLVLLDGGHNPDAVSSVLTAVREEFSFDRLTAVVGMLDDKAIEDVVPMLAAAAERFVLTAPAADRAADPDRLLRALGSAADRAVLQDGVDVAVARAIAEAGPEDAVLVIGSFYTVGEARAFLRTRA